MAQMAERGISLYVSFSIDNSFTTDRQKNVQLVSTHSLSVLLIVEELTCE